jgi:hypothetical protein
MRRFAAAALSVMMLVAPRVARAELWINLDSRLIVKHFGGVCAQMRTSGKYTVYKCDKTKGASLIFMRASQVKNSMPYTCTLSYWGSGPRGDTWHADMHDQEAIRCPMSWDNDNTLTIKLGDK